MPRAHQHPHAFPARQHGEINLAELREASRRSAQLEQHDSALALATEEDDAAAADATDFLPVLLSRGGSMKQQGVHAAPPGRADASALAAASAGIPATSAPSPSPSVATLLAKAAWKSNAIVLQSAVGQQRRAADSPAAASASSSSDGAHMPSYAPGRAYSNIHATVLPPPQKRAELKSIALDAQVAAAAAAASASSSFGRGGHSTRLPLSQQRAVAQPSGGYASHAQAFYNSLLSSAEEVARGGASSAPARNFFVHVPLTAITADTILDSDVPVLRAQKLLDGASGVEVAAPLGEGTTAPVSNTATPASSTTPLSRPRQLVASHSVVFNGVDMARLHEAAQLPQSVLRSAVGNAARRSIEGPLQLPNVVLRPSGATTLQPTAAADKLTETGESALLVALKREHSGTTFSATAPPASVAAQSSTPVASAARQATVLCSATGQALDASALANARRLLQQTLAATSASKSAFSYTHEQESKSQHVQGSRAALRGSQTERVLQRLVRGGDARGGVTARETSRSGSVTIGRQTRAPFHAPSARSLHSLQPRSRNDSAAKRPTAPIKRSCALQTPLAPLRAAATSVEAKEEQQSAPESHSAAPSLPSDAAATQQPSSSAVYAAAHAVLESAPSAPLAPSTVDASAATLEGATSARISESIAVAGSKSIEPAALIAVDAPVSLLDPPVQPAASSAASTSAIEGEGDEETPRMRYRRPPAEQHAFLSSLQQSFLGEISTAASLIASQARSLGDEASTSAVLQNAEMQRQSRAHLAALDGASNLLAATREDALAQAEKEHTQCASALATRFAAKETLLSARLTQLASSRQARSCAREAALALQREEDELSALSELARAQRLAELDSIEQRLLARANKDRQRWEREWQESIRQKETARMQAERDALVMAQEILAYKRRQYEKQRLQARQGVLWVRVVRAKNLGEHPNAPENGTKSLTGTGSTQAQGGSFLPPSSSSCLSISLRFQAASLANETVWTRHFGRDPSPLLEEVFKLRVGNATLQNLIIATQANGVRQVESWERELRMALAQTVSRTAAAAAAAANAAANATSPALSSMTGAGDADSLATPSTTDGSLMNGGMGSSSIPLHTQLEDLARQGHLIVRSAALGKDPLQLVGPPALGNGFLSHRRHVSLHAQQSPISASHRRAATTSAAVQVSHAAAGGAAATGEEKDALASHAHYPLRFIASSSSSSPQRSPGGSPRGSASGSPRSGTPTNQQALGGSSSPSNSPMPPSAGPRPASGGGGSGAATNGAANVSTSNTAEAAPSTKVRAGSTLRVRTHSRMFVPGFNGSVGTGGAGLLGSGDVVVSSLSSPALVQLGAQARLRDRSEILSRTEELGSVSISLASLRNAPGGRMHRELALTTQMTEQKRKEREVERKLALKKPVGSTTPNAAVAAAIPEAKGKGSKSVKKLSSAASLTKLPGLPAAGAERIETLHCGSVQVELLLLPLFGTAAAANEKPSAASSAARRARRGPSQPLRIGQSELSPEEQRLVELELEREAEMAANALVMPKWSALAGGGVGILSGTVDGGAENEDAAAMSSAPLVGLRMQMSPAVRARAILGSTQPGGIVSPQASPTSLGQGSPFALASSPSASSLHGLNVAPTQSPHVHRSPSVASMHGRTTPSMLHVSGVASSPAEPLDEPEPVTASFVPGPGHPDWLMMTAP